jgi:hypothetical protein
MGRFAALTVIAARVAGDTLRSAIIPAAAGSWRAS